MSQQSDATFSRHRGSKEMQILFLHGWNSVPGGRKPTFLLTAGHTVFNPELHDDDFDESVEIAQVEYDEHQPDVVVGSPDLLRLTYSRPLTENTCS